MAPAMNTRSWTRYRSSLLSLPIEVRFNIYEQLFRDTQIEVHNTAVHLDTCPQPKRKESMNLLLTAKIINREATPIFFRETDFRIRCEHCWTIHTDQYLDWPPIQNLTIEYQRYMSCYNYPRFIGGVTAGIARRFERKPSMNSLVFNHAIYESIAPEHVLPTLLYRAPQFVRQLRVTMSLRFEGQMFNVIFANGRSLVEVETRKHMCRTGLEKIQDLLERYELHLSKPVRTPEEAGSIRILSRMDRGMLRLAYRGSDCPCDLCAVRRSRLRLEYLKQFGPNLPRLGQSG